MRIKSCLVASLLLAQAVLPIALVNAVGPPQAKPAGFVLPSEVSAKEPFTFSASGVVEGEVIDAKTVEGEVVSVKTLEGEVVQTRKADKFGRIFLPAGLAAGAYLLTRSNSKGTAQITIKPPSNTPGGSPLKISNVPKACNIQNGLSLKGQAFNPNADSMAVTIGDKQIPVLAATASEIKTGALSETLCGHFDVKVRNTKTGESDQIPSLTIYSLKAKLGRQKLVGGEQTTLEFTFKPADTTATVNVRIISGPVTFQSGVTEQKVEIQNGKATIPLVADPTGVGAFRVAYDLEKIGDKSIQGNYARP